MTAVARVLVKGVVVILTLEPGSISLVGRASGI